MELEYLGLERFNAADYFLDRNIREGREDKVAVVCEDRQLTYGELTKQANRFGNALASSGIRMENRVALLMLDMELYPAAFLGAIKTGAVPICLNTLMRPKDYLYFLNDSRARVLVVDESLYFNIEEVKSDLLFLEKIVVVNRQGEKPDTVSYEEFVERQPDTLEPAPPDRMMPVSGCTAPVPPANPRARSTCSMTCCFPWKLMENRCSRSGKTMCAFPQPRCFLLTAWATACIFPSVLGPPPC